MTSWFVAPEFPALAAETPQAAASLQAEPEICVSPCTSLLLNSDPDGEWRDYYTSVHKCKAAPRKWYAITLCADNLPQPPRGSRKFLDPSSATHPRDTPKFVRLGPPTAGKSR